MNPDTRSTLPASESSRFTLTGYTLAAASLLSAASGHADIVYTPLGDLVLNPGDQVDLDFNVPGGTFTLSLNVDELFDAPPNAVFTSSFEAKVFGAGQWGVEVNGKPQVLSFGQNIRTAPNGFGSADGVLGFHFFRSIMTSISSPSTFTTPSGGTTMTSIPVPFSYPSSGGDGNFRGRNNAYLGLKVNNGSTDFYGWVQLSLNPNADMLTVHDWAYENAGADLAAGQVPEASTLGLLAGGAAALAAWRRMKRKREQSAADA